MRGGLGRGGVDDAHLPSGRRRVPSRAWDGSSSQLVVNVAVPYPKRS